MSDLFDLNFSHLAIFELPRTVIYIVFQIIENQLLVSCVVAYTALVVTDATKLSFCVALFVLCLQGFSSVVAAQVVRHVTFHVVLSQVPLRL